jgi:hypothetical protein
VSTLENSSLFEKKPEYKTALKVVAIPERVIQFRVGHYANWLISDTILPSSRLCGRMTKER